MSERVEALVEVAKQYCSTLNQLSITGEALAEQFRNIGEYEKRLERVSAKCACALKDISASQRMLLDSLNSVFVTPVENFYVQTTETCHSMEKNYRHLQEEYTESLAHYLQDEPRWPLWEGKAQQVLTQKRSLELCRYDLVCAINETEERKSFELGEHFCASLCVLKSHFRQCSDELDITCEPVSDISAYFQNERENFEERAVTVIEKRKSFEHGVETMIEAAVLQLGLGEQRASTPEMEKDKSSPGSGKKDDGPVPVDASLGSIDDVDESEEEPGGYETPATTPSKPLTYDVELYSSSKKHHRHEKGTLSSMRASIFGSFTTPERPATPYSTDDSQFKRYSTEHSLLLVSTYELELRIHALDFDSLRNHYVAYPQFCARDVLIQGYLWRRNPAKRLQQESWSRHWCVLDSEKLYCVNEGETISAPLELQVTIACSIRHRLYYYNMISYRYYAISYYVIFGRYGCPTVLDSHSALRLRTLL